RSGHPRVRWPRLTPPATGEPQRERAPIVNLLYRSVEGQVPQPGRSGTGEDRFAGGLEQPDLPQHRHQARSLGVVEREQWPADVGRLQDTKDSQTFLETDPVVTHGRTENDV